MTGSPVASAAAVSPSAVSRGSTLNAATAVLWAWAARRSSAVLARLMAAPRGGVGGWEVVALQRITACLPGPCQGCGPADAGSRRARDPVRTWLCRAGQRHRQGQPEAAVGDGGS